MQYWLHRIGWLESVSYPLLEAGYMSIGFSDFSTKIFLEKSSEEDGVYFDNQFEEIWGNLARSRYSLWKFLAEMKKGDWVVIPSGGNFSVYEIVENSAILPSSFEIKDGFSDWYGRKIIHDKSGMFKLEGEKDYLDIGFLRKVKSLFIDMSRYDYADAALTARMKIRNTNANISDLEKNIKNAIEAFKKNKPINLKSSFMKYSVEYWLKIMRKELTPDKFERLIGKYMERVGATSVAINPEKNSEDKVGDVDIVAIFESIKTIINIQVKNHEGETSDWAVHQINDFAKSKQNVSDGYSRIYWVISSSDSFSKDAEKLAIKNDVLLFDGKQFIQMLMEAGIENIDEL
jgi:predicted Mrr-cat superfamily restriction endonuclease